MRGADGAALSILVVEDEHAVAELVRALLGQLAGWRATVVHDAPAARHVFRHVPVDVLLVDVNLPGISGPELLELLRRDPTWDEPPVVLMSADADQPEIRAALRRGVAARFIPKPFNADHLVEEIRSAAAGRQEQGGARTAESSPGARLR
jgi:CheY-like chemotaxis protein